jgi:hypothetical protein
MSEFRSAEQCLADLYSAAQGKLGPESLSYLAPDTTTLITP